MIQQVLTFSGQNDINVSLQVGDIVYYSPVVVVGQFATIDNVNTIVTFGVCTAIYSDGNAGFGVPPNSIVVLYDDTTLLPPTPGDYIMFSKNKEVNSSSLKGYFAEIKFENFSTEKIELFSIAAEVSESSK